MSGSEIIVRWIGEEREPLVIIENLAADPYALREAARRLDFAPIGKYYPGVRAAVTNAYFEMVGPTIFYAIREFFGYRQSLEVLRSYYSLMTTPPAELELAQRIPHTDALDDSQIAVLHYLSEQHADGTAFFRHRSTGYETVNEGRYQDYEAKLKTDFERVGEPYPAYIGDSNVLFDKILEYPARFNHALIYRGKLLHCASMREPERLANSPEAGRLTVASFIAAK